MNWKYAFGALALISMFVISHMNAELKALRWDKAELQLTVNELYAKLEYAEAT